MAFSCAGWVTSETMRRCLVNKYMVIRSLGTIQSSIYKANSVKEIEAIEKENKEIEAIDC
jgi:hypothetical protein